MHVHLTIGREIDLNNMIPVVRITQGERSHVVVERGVEPKGYTQRDVLCGSVGFEVVGRHAAGARGVVEVHRVSRIGICKRRVSNHLHCTGHISRVYGVAREWICNSGRSSTNDTFERAQNST